MLKMNELNNDSNGDKSVTAFSPFLKHFKLNQHCLSNRELKSVTTLTNIILKSLPGNTFLIKA